MFVDVPPDMCDDILEAMKEEFAGPDIPPFPADFGDESDDEVFDAESAVRATMLGGESSDEESRPASGVEARLAINISSTGHVTSDAPGWKAFGNIGRITQWPAKAHPADQNVSIRCYLHPGCSVARKRLKYSDDQLLDWLFQGELPSPTAKPAEKKLMGQKHFALRDEMLPSAKAVSKAS